MVDGGSRELIPETRGSILEGTFCYSYDVDGRGSVTNDEEQVLRGGRTVIRLWRYEGWLVVRTL